MKENIMTEIKNTKEALTCIRYLQNRPKSEMVGLGLFYGDPGISKTRFALKFATVYDYMYVRLVSTMTTKGFLLEIHRALRHKYSLAEDEPRGSTYKIYCIVRDLLAEHPDAVVFIDEIDYAFRDHKLLGAVRDLADQTSAILIMVGMQNAKHELLKSNPHFFDRTNYFVRFEQISEKEVQHVCAQISDIEIDNELAHQVFKMTGGTIRKVVKAMYAIETIAARKETNRLEYKDVPEGLLEMGSASSSIRRDKAAK